MRRCPRGFSWARIKTFLNFVRDISQAVREAIVETQHREKFPRHVRRAGNRAPEKGDRQFPQIARLAISQNIQMMRQLERFFGVELFYFAVSGALPGGVAEIKERPQQLAAGVVEKAIHFCFGDEEHREARDGAVLF